MKRVVGIMAVIAILSAVSGCSKKQEPVQTATAKPAEDYVFKIGFPPHGLCGAPIYVAESKGYYDEEGLRWESIVVGDGEAMNLLTAGSIDGTFGLLVGIIQPLANGFPVQVPLTMHTGCIKALVRGDDGSMQTPDNLKGKKIGTGSPSAPTTLFVKRYLAGKGFKVDGENADIEFIYQSAAELPLILNRGIVDAIVLTDPSAQVAQDANGFRTIIDNATDEEFKNEFCCVVDVRTETIKKYPETTAKFLRAIQKASKFVEDYPEETARILADTKRAPGDPEVNGRILRSFNYAASVSAVLPALSRNAKDLQALGILKPDVDVDKLIQDTFIAVPGVPDSLF